MNFKWFTYACVNIECDRSIPVKVLQGLLEALNTEDIGDFGESTSLNGARKTLVGLNQSECVVVFIDSVTSNLGDCHWGVLVQVLISESVTVGLSTNQSGSVQVGHLRSEERVGGSLDIVQVLNIDG